MEGEAFLAFSLPIRKEQLRCARMAGGITWQHGETLLRMIRTGKMMLELIPKQFFLNGCIVIEFTYHKLHPFKAYNSVVFSAFTESHSHHRGLILEDSSPLRTLSPRAITPPRAPLPALPKAEATVSLLSISIDLPIRDIPKRVFET